MKPSGPEWTAIATVILAAVTAWVALEARTARLKAVQRDREIVFRAALMELALNVQRLETWMPLLQDTPPTNWLDEPLPLTAMKDLLARVWVPSGLWNRIMALMTNFQAYVEVITAQIRSLPPDAATRGEYFSQRENIRNLYYLIDLYLKQLACYLAAEMRRQRLGAPQEWDDNRPLFAPLGWRYDVAFGGKLVAETAERIESGPAWPPFTPQAPEPDDSAYRECRLERLIERAREKSEKEREEIRSAYDIQPEAGYS
jgi:hypothetical protein